MLSLTDGRAELYQYDTGRTLTINGDCTQVHFGRNLYGRSIDVDVIDGKAMIPDVLLQSDKDLIAWAYVGTSDNGYTSYSKVFKINRRNKPADYVFTPPEQTTLEDLSYRLGELEKYSNPDSLKIAVDSYLETNPIDEADPTVPDWAKKETPPTYTAEDVGALPDTTKIPSLTSDLTNDSEYITVEVATLINYYLKTEVYSKNESYSNTEIDSLISGLDKRLNAIADSDDVTLDQLSEVVSYIKNNRELIESVTTAKVSISDIIDDLTTAEAKKPLSAAQGKALKDLYDALPAWAKAATKPSYTKAEVGLGNVENVKQYSTSNPPPYPVTSVNGKTGAVSIAVPSKTSDISNDSGFITKTVSDLDNYYQKNETYTQDETKTAIDDAIEEVKASGEFNGKDGVSIESIEKTGTSGLVDTYTITMTDDKTSEFAVTNGKDGVDSSSISSIKQTVVSEEDGGENQVEITLTNGEKSTIVLRNGNPGLPGDANLAPPIVENAEGEVITVSDSAERPLQGLRVFGKTEQFSTTGKNLAHPNKFSNTVNGYTITPNNDGTITISGSAEAAVETVIHLALRNTNNEIIPTELTANNTYTLTVIKDGVNNQCGAKIVLEDGTVKWLTTNKLLFEQDATVEMLYKQFTPTVGDTTYCGTYAVQIELGEEATAYEPYTGGKPSPSPEYPQELESVESASVAVTGKNLCPVNSITAEEIAGGRIDVTTNVHGTYTLSADITRYSDDDVTNPRITLRAKYDDGSENVKSVACSENDGVTRHKTVTLTTDTNKTLTMLRTYVFNYNSVTYRNAKAENIQLELGSTATAYEPYKNGGTLALANTLHGIPVDSGGNYTDEDGQQWICDEVDFARGKFVQRVNAVTFDGSSDEAWIKNNSSDDTQWLYYINVGNRTPSRGICDKLIHTTVEPLYDYGICGFNTTHSQYPVAYVNLSSYMTENTVGALRVALSENPITILYALSTPIETDLTAEEMAQYEALRSQKPNTVITNDSDAYMSADYVADTKIYIDNKFAELSAAIVNNA